VNGSGDFSTRLWNVQTGEEVKRFQSIEGQILSVAFSPDGHSFLAGDDNIARLWDLAAGGVVRNFKGHSARVTSVAFSHDGAFVLTGSDDKTARLWDTNTGLEVRRFDGHGTVNAVAVSSDSHFVLTAEDKIARLWNLENGAELRDFGKEDTGAAQKPLADDLNEVSSVAISPDAHYVLTATYSKTVHLWDVATGQETKHF
jgi:WD40 repeat protein